MQPEWQLDMRHKIVADPLQLYAVDSNTSVPQRGFMQTERPAEAGNCPQDVAISGLVHLFQQRVTLPQSIGEGPGMGLIIQRFSGDPAGRIYRLKHKCNV